MRTRHSFFLLVLCCAPLLDPAVAGACTCLPPGSVFEELVESDAVFRGEVTLLEDAGSEPADQVWVTLDVEEAWKGAVGASVRVLTARFGASCGYHFELGERYLVYARDRARGTIGASHPATYTVSMCSRTHASGPEDPDPAVLRELVTGAPWLRSRPNPSTDHVRITWTAPAGAVSGRLEVLDFQGRRVASLFEGRLASRVGVASWDGRDAHGRRTPPGIYWARLTSGSRVVSQKLVRVAVER
jgi:hypothetical protein